MGKGRGAASLPVCDAVVPCGVSERSGGAQHTETLQAQRAYLADIGHSWQRGQRERGALMECALRAEWSNEAAH